MTRDDLIKWANTNRGTSYTISQIAEAVLDLHRACMELETKLGALPFDGTYPIPPGPRTAGRREQPPPNSGEGQS